jgi:hypothetical protein
VDFTAAVTKQFKGVRDVRESELRHWITEKLNNSAKPKLKKPSKTLDDMTTITKVEESIEPK